MIDPLSAIAATPTRTVAGPPPASSAVTATATPSFSETLGQVAGKAMDTLQTGEAAAIQGVEGSTTPFKVVEAVMDAQRTLQAALAIRDKAVGAYQEISRMAI